MYKTVCILALGAVSALLVTGCSGTRSDPCALLTNEEVRMFDDGVVKSVWMPLGKDETNELCMYVDINDEPVLMLFAWFSGDVYPEETVKDGMQGEGKIVHIFGVGDEAVAGFKGQELKLFAARTSSGMVGFRAPGIRNEESDSFSVIKDLANTALLRLH